MRNYSDPPQIQSLRHHFPKSCLGFHSESDLQWQSQGFGVEETALNPGVLFTPLPLASHVK
jgi:hypothetical protein